MYGAKDRGLQLQSLAWNGARLGAPVRPPRRDPHRWRRDWQRHCGECDS